MTDKVIHSDIYRIIKAAVIDGLAIVQQFEVNNKTIFHYFDFPILSELPSGLPSFRKSFLGDDAPLDYKSIFKNKSQSPDDIPSWRSFFEFAEKYEALSRFWEIGPYTKEMHIDGFPDFQKTYSQSKVYGSIEELVDRYIHISGKKVIDEEIFLPIYQEWEQNIFSDILTFNILIPILGLTFKFKQLKIDSNIFIDKMDEPIQLARNNRSTYSVSTHEIVIGAATHALVLKGWTIKNDTLNQRGNVLSDVRNYSAVIFQIDNFFAALRAVTSVETGYSQIVIAPIGWAASWQAYLPPVNVVTVRAYPEHFENYSWLKTSPTLEEHTFDNVTTIFNTLINTKNDRIALAARRLNLAFLRTNEADSILDVTIGLETLLTSDTQTEITYKLAMRASLLSTIEKFEDLSPGDVFDYCKRIYDYRSKVIHGSKKAQQKRIIKLANESEISAVRLGINILRCVISVLSHHPEYLNSKKLDKLFLIRKDNNTEPNK